MQLGVNVPNFGPGTDPGVLREWAHTVEGLGFDLLMVSDHVTITPDVAERYPAPFYEPFTALSWLAGITTRVRLGTTVLILPYRHPLLVARMSTNLHHLSGGRFILGVGVGWARQEFAALGVPFAQRGKLTDEYLTTVQDAWREEFDDATTPPPPIWVGGNTEAGIRRAVRFGKPWHPLRLTLPQLSAAVANNPLPGFTPRIALRLTDAPINDPDRLAGIGTLEQILADLTELQRLGAETVVLDPYHADPEETRHPETAWQTLAAVATHWKATP